ncbi:hypothetical protein TSMEX_007719, partial [Taenia solium]
EVSRCYTRVHYKCAEGRATGWKAKLQSIEWLCNQTLISKESNRCTGNIVLPGFFTKVGHNFGSTYTARMSGNRGGYRHYGKPPMSSATSGTVAEDPNI